MGTVNSVVIFILANFNAGIHLPIAPFPAMPETEMYRNNFSPSDAETD